MKTLKAKYKTFLMLLIAMTSNSFGDVLLARTMTTVCTTDVQSLAQAWDIGMRMLHMGTFWGAIGLFTVFFALWTALMHGEDLSYILPLSAITYVISAILAGPMLGETVTPLRWTGTVLICIGVGLVAGTDGKANEQSPGATPPGDSTTATETNSATTATSAEITDSAMAGAATELAVAVAPDSVDET